MYKDIIDKDSLQDPKQRGMAKIAGAVKRTLGPGGLPILIERKGQALDGTPLGPKITKDGVSVADECSSKDPEEDVVIQAVKSICKKTNTDAGDGTTTAIVLGEALLRETDKVLKNDTTLNPQLVKESVEQASKDVIERLKQIATPVKDHEMIKEVATVSANGDSDVGEIISQAFKKVGAEGMVTVDEGYTNHVTLDVVDGYQFNRGAEARTNFFNNSSQTQFEAENVSVVIYDGSLQNYTSLIPLLTMFAAPDESGRPTKKFPPLLIIANDFTSEVVNFLLMQKQQLGMIVVPVRGPHATHVRTGYYDDLAYYTGGTRLGNGGRSITAVEPDDIGEAGRVIVDKYKTTIYDGLGDEDELLGRVEQLKDQKSQAETPYDAQVISERIAALTQGVAKIGVGGATEFEIKEKYDRIEDALNAARAAMQEGIVAGGGSTLLRISYELAQGGFNTIGEEILSKALSAPFNQILENIGYEISADDVQEIIENEKLTYNARTRQIVNAFEDGIVDPVKVTRSALENAVSISSLLSTAGGAIVYKHDK